MNNFTIYAALGPIATPALDNSALFAAPQTALLIRSLSILAACTIDTSLENNRTISKIRLLDTPKSFRASLYQTTSSMSDAFRTADQAMFRIKVNLDDVPLIMSSLVRAYTKPKDNGSKIISNLRLKSLNQKVKMCTEEAGKARQKFDDTLELIKELIQVTTATVGDNEEKVRESIKLLKVYEKDKIFAQQEAKRLQAAIEKQKADIQKAKTTYNKAAKKMTNWKNVASSYADIFNDISESIVKNDTVIGSGNKRESVRKRMEDVSEATSSATKTYEKAAELAKDMLIHQKNMEQMLINEETANRMILAQIAGKLATTEVEELHMNDVIHYLSKGLQTLGKIQDQWARLQNYLASIESVVLIPITQDISDFDTLVREGDVENSTLIRNELAITCIKAAGACMSVGRSAGLYNAISKKLVTPQVDLAVVKMAMEREEAKCKNVLPALPHQMESESKQIRNFIGIQWNEYESKTRDQLKSLRDTIEDALGSGQIRLIL